MNGGKGRAMPQAARAAGADAPEPQASPQSSIPIAGRGDFESVLAVKRETPAGGYVHFGLGRLTVGEFEEAAVAIEVAHPDADNGIVAQFSLRLPTFSVMLECMMEIFAAAQAMEAGTTTSPAGDVAPPCDTPDTSDSSDHPRRSEAPSVSHE